MRKIRRRNPVRRSRRNNLIRRSHHPNSRRSRLIRSRKPVGGDLSSLPRYPLIYPDEDGYNTTGTRSIRLSDAQVDEIQNTLDTMRNDEKTNHDNNKGDAAL